MTFLGLHVAVDDAGGVRGGVRRGDLDGGGVRGGVRRGDLDGDVEGVAQAQGR